MGSKSFLLLIQLVCVSLSQAIEIEEYPGCSSDLDNPGFFSTQRDDYIFYSHCNFPNPRIYPLSCGRSSLISDQHSVCNVRHILSTEDAINMDTTLAYLEGNTSMQCRDEEDHLHNITVLVLIMDHIRATNLSDPSAICQNNCGELLPELVYDYTTVNLTDTEAQFAADVFSQRLADEWGEDACNTTVVILYWKRFQKLSTGVSYKLHKKLTWSEIDEIHDDAMPYFIDDDDIVGGVNYIIERYKEELTDSAPAYWLMFANLGLLILCFLFMTCQYNQYKGGAPTGVFDEGVMNVLLGVLFRVLTGLILIELLLRAMLFLDYYLKIWHVVLLAVLAVAGFILLLLLF